MYQVLLTRRYLFSKVMPLLASLGVMLCTAVVLVTWSVMGGFLVMLINTGRTMAGDVVVRWSGTGFPYYDDLVARLEADPRVEAAAPLIEAFGMISLPDGTTEGVMFRGVDGPSFAKVSQLEQILWWRPLATRLPKDTSGSDPRLGAISGTSWQDIYQHGLALRRPDPRTGELKPAVVPGIHVMGTSRRTREGFYYPRVTIQRLPDGSVKEIEQFMPRDGSVTVMVLPLDSKGKVTEPYSSVLPVANEFQSGVFDYDSRVVLIDLAEAQRMLRMNEAKRVAEPGEQGVKPPDTEGFAGESSQPGLVTDPARVTDVLVKGRGRMATTQDANELKHAVENVYVQFAKAHPGQVPDAMDITILTWEDQNRTFINAVKNEISLLLGLFCFLSITVIFLTIAIFWSMVREKTMDIGVMRAVGATQKGVAGLWLTYGLAIGLVGSSLGMALAYALVVNINPIHEWLGDTFGIVIWDPAVYYFTKIPNQVDPAHATIVFAGGVLSCVVGALIPAVRAAHMHPVRALRND